MTDAAQDPPQGNPTVKLRQLLIALIAFDICALAAFAAETNIDQVNQRFSKSSLTLSTGDSVTYHNGDDVTHNINVTLDGGDPEDQGLQKPGETIKYVFSKSGTYDVRCSIHPRMKMSVTVQ